MSEEVADGFDGHGSGEQAVSAGETKCVGSLMSFGLDARFL
jgi:hypothetical protein